MRPFLFAWGNDFAGGMRKLKICFPSAIVFRYLDKV